MKSGEYYEYYMAKRVAGQSGPGKCEQFMVGEGREGEGGRGGSVEKKVKALKRDGNFIET